MTIFLKLTVKEETVKQFMEAMSKHYSRRLVERVQKALPPDGEVLPIDLDEKIQLMGLTNNDVIRWAKFVADFY